MTPHANTNIFSDTIAEMTWMEVDQAAKDGAILLWAFGVIEQHGPHLPTGTDVYIPQARLRETKKILAERGITALIVPPYYWGINVASGAFPASYRVRPELMKELMSDLFESFSGDGFRHVFCFSGHGDKLHNLTIHQGIKMGVERTGMDVSFVSDTALLLRLGIPLDDPCVTVHKSGSGKLFGALTSSPSAFDEDDKPPKYVDVHAGQWETSMMLCSCPRPRSRRGAQDAAVDRFRPRRPERVAQRIRACAGQDAPGLSGRPRRRKPRRRPALSAAVRRARRGCHRRKAAAKKEPMTSPCRNHEAGRAAGPCAPAPAFRPRPYAR